MKQKITIKASTASTGHRFRILSSWEVNNEILVLLENNSGNGGGDASGYIEEKFEVETSAKDELPVKFYIVNNRDNRGFNSHQYFGTEPDDANPFHFLLSVYDFNKLVVGGKLLAKGAIEIFDLRTLLRVESIADARLKASDLLGNAEKIAGRLLAQNPSSYAMYKIMLKAGIFNGDPLDNINLIGNLVDGMQKLSPADQEKMLKLYRMLADGEQCVLTGYMHDVISDEMFGKVEYNHCGLDGYLEFMQDLQPLNAKMVNTIFLDPYFALSLHRFIATFDKTFECERYLYATVNDPDKISTLANDIDNGLYISKRNGEQLYPWMTTELFKLIVDHIKDYYSVISGLHTLHRYGMLDSHQEQFMKNIKAANVFSLFNSREIMQAEFVIPALENTRFREVKKFFESLDHIGQWSFSANKEEVNKQLAAILCDQELTAAVCDLAAIYELKYDEFYNQNKRGIGYQESQAFKAPFKQELVELIAAAQVKPRPASTLRDSTLSSVATNLFAPPPPLTLAEKHAQMKAKYGVEEVKHAADLK